MIHVTTLADDGPGSLRAAVQASGPRRIVFDVAGEIWLQSTLLITGPHLTIDGSAAPSPGISLMGNRIRVRSHDVVIRHLRIRIGERDDGSPPDNRDAISIDGGEDGRSPSYNITIENCSFAWAVDENFQVWGAGNRNIVIRNSIIAEALNRSIHPKGAHSMGMIIGPGVGPVLIERNLFLSNAARNPVLHGGSRAMVVNNLIVNPSFSAVHFYPHARSGPTMASIIGNVVVAGPQTRKRLRSFEHGLNSGSQIHYSGNLARGTAAFDEQEGVGRPEVPGAPFVPAPPLQFGGQPVLPSGAVESKVLETAGARPDDRDALDRRFISEARRRGGSIVDQPSDPRLRRGLPPR